MVDPEPVDPASLPAEDATRLVTFAERPRIGDWTLRSALVRHAQREPTGASAILELVRRTDTALAPYAKRLETRAVADVAGDDDAPPSIVDLLAVAAVLDRMGDLLAGWADDRSGGAPDDEVRRMASAVQARLDQLGVARERRPPRRAG